MGADVNLRNNAGQSVLSIVSVNRNQIPDYENILHIITNYKPMKVCIYNQKNRSIFNSRLFVIFHVIAESVIYFILLPYVDTPRNVILFYIFSFLLVLTFCFVHFSDPGEVKCEDNRSWLELTENKVYLNDYCPYCKIQKTVTIKHCHLCNICVDGFDHHCNWIDNCVGGNNVVRFFIFLLVILGNLCFSYYISLFAFIFGDSYKNASIKTNPITEFDTGEYYSFFSFTFLLRFKARNLMSIFIMSVCILFFVPVSYVLWVQIKNRGICKKRINTSTNNNKSNISNMV